MKMKNVKMNKLKPVGKKRTGLVGFSGFSIAGNRGMHLVCE